MAYDKNNSGSLFKNNRKEKPTHPDYTGKINANGEDYYLSAWVKEGKNGKFFSLALKPVSERQQLDTGSGGNHIDSRHDMDDEIPF